VLLCLPILCLLTFIMGDMCGWLCNTYLFLLYTICYCLPISHPVSHMLTPLVSLCLPV